MIIVTFILSLSTNFSNLKILYKYNPRRTEIKRVIFGDVALGDRPLWIVVGLYYRETYCPGKNALC